MVRLLFSVEDGRPFGRLGDIALRRGRLAAIGALPSRLQSDLRVEMPESETKPRRMQSKRKNSAAVVSGITIFPGPVRNTNDVLTESARH
jgi:hypothetical protein